MEHSYFIGLGGNIGQPRQTFDKVLLELNKLVGTVLNCSSFIQSAPLPLPSGKHLEQDDFLNTVLEIKTEKKPLEVFSILLEIERAFGRNRNEERIRWGPRIIDLDIIAIDQERFESEQLIVPHPEMHKRRFVLQPMYEICPNWVHPVSGKSLKQMMEELGDSSACPQAETTRKA